MLSPEEAVEIKVGPPGNAGGTTRGSARWGSTTIGAPGLGARLRSGMIDPVVEIRVDRYPLIDVSFDRAADSLETVVSSLASASLDGRTGR